MDKFYINPRIEIEGEHAIDRLLPTVPESVESLKVVYSQQNVIVTSGPGNGKSRLLKEVTAQATHYRREAAFVDLKKVHNENSSIEEFIQKYQKRRNKDVKTSDGSINDFLKTTDFQLEDTNSCVVCLDALDEVKSEGQESTIGKIIDFHHDYPQVKIIISSRDYIYDRFTNLLGELHPAVIKVSPFQRKEVTEFLNQSGFTADQIEQVLLRFGSSYAIHVIDSPRVLEIFVELTKKESLEKTLQMTKADLLDRFIYKKLEKEDKKFNKNKRDAIKRTLERLALVMHIYQTREIKKDELATFFEDIPGIDTRMGDEFYNRSLLTENEDTVQFENAEFQDYLAAKSIITLGEKHLNQYAFDLAVNQKLDTIFPFWFNSLAYLVQLKPAFQSNFVDFVIRRERKSDTRLLQYLLVEPKHIVSPEQQSEIFRNTFLYFQNNNWSLGRDNAASLAQYYLLEDEDLLKQEAGNKPEENNRTLNICRLVSSIRKGGGSIDDEYWKGYFADVLRSRSNGIVAHIALQSVAAFSDLSLIKDNFSFIEDTDDDTAYEYVRACQQAEPNSEYVIDLLFLDRNYHIHPKPNFDKVTSKEGILYFLRKLAEQAQSRLDLLYKPLDRIKQRFVLEEVIGNVRKVYDSDIEEAISSLILATSYYNEKQGFIYQLALLLKEENSGYVFSVISSTDDPTEKRGFEFLVRSFVNQTNAEAIIQALLSKSYGKVVAANIFQTFNNSEDVIYEISKKYVDDEYKAPEERHTQYTSKLERQLGEYDILEDFRIKLEPEEGKYIPDVFRFYNSRKDQLEERMTNTDFDRLKYLITCVIENYDFESVTVIKEGNTTKLSESLVTFNDALSLVKELNIDYQPYRAKIISFIPFCFTRYSEDSSIFDLVESLTKEEIAELIQFYKTDREDDLFYSNIRNLLGAVEYYQITEALPVVRKVVLDSAFREYDRVEALRLIQKIKPDYQLCCELLENTSDTDLLKAASEILLSSQKTSHKTTGANWRFERFRDQIISYNPEEHGAGKDYHRMDYFDGLISLPMNDSQFIDNYLDLFRLSIQILEKEYIACADAAWSIVFQYAESLKIHENIASTKEVEFIKEIRTIINDSEVAKASGQLLWRYEGLEHSYNEVCKPTHFTDSIKKFKELKERQYKDIYDINDLKELVVKAIDEDLRNWIEEEGAYSIVNDYKIVSKTSDSPNQKALYETFIQKTLKPEFKNILINRGLRPSEVSIRREEQLLDDQRTDFIISYGILGSILIEIKLTGNPQVESSKARNTYKSKLSKYITGTYSSFGIFLIFQVNDKNRWEDLRLEVEKVYEDMPNVKVIGLDCTAGKQN